MKRFLILIFILFLSGCVSIPDREEIVGNNFNNLKKGMSKLEVKSFFDQGYIDKNPFTMVAWSSQRCRAEYHSNKQMEILSSPKRDTHLVFENVTIPKVGCNTTKDHGNGIFHSAHNSLMLAQEIVSKSKTISKNNEIMFTIKDKREQCEAIGFKPETEKFADCVLRLVELDVKQQTQNQITVAQNNGNDALVKQLERQNNLQLSQSLMNLGQQLMNPTQYNSNIYMPQTTRCTMQGFGAFATMRCR